MNLSNEQIAELVYEANRAQCEAVGDTSQSPWEECEQWQKDSIQDGIQYLRDNPDATPEQTHDNWMMHKRKDGWRYGEVKDVEKKLHPCMLPYQMLPLRQRIKDHVFAAIVRTSIKG